MKYQLGDFVQFRNKDSIFMKLILVHNFLYYRKHKDYKKYNGGANHTAIITKVEKDVIGLSEAIGVKPFQEFDYDRAWLDRKIESGDIWLRRPIYKMKDVKKNAEKYYGKKYDWLAIWAIFLKSVLGMKSKIANKFKGEKMLMCSEGSLRIAYDCTDKKLDLTTEWQEDTDFIPPICIDLSKQFEDVK